MSNLNKEEYALLSQFSYIDLPSNMVKKYFSNSKASMSFSEVLNNLSEKNAYKKYLTNDQITLVHKMLNSPEICKLNFVQYENKDVLIGNKEEYTHEQKGKGITGFAAMGFVTPEGNPLAIFEVAKR